MYREASEGVGTDGWDTGRGPSDPGTPAVATSPSQDRYGRQEVVTRHTPLLTTWDCDWVGGRNRPGVTQEAETRLRPASGVLWVPSRTSITGTESKGALSTRASPSFCPGSSPTFRPYNKGSTRGAETETPFPDGWGRGVRGVKPLVLLKRPPRPSRPRNYW